VQIFEEENSLPRHEGRRVWIDGRHIVVQCAQKEVDDILNHLELDVAKINQKYREILMKKSLGLEEDWES
jgi:hypothetical protein